MFRDPLRRAVWSPALALLLAQSFGLAAPRAVASQAVPPDSAIRAILRERVESKRSAGIVVGVIDSDGHRRVVAFGTSGPNGALLDGNSAFEIGSITKTFTTAILADMVARREVQLDDPVARYLPTTVRIPSRSGRQITLIDLATQSSGLPRMPSNFAPKDPINPYADYSVRQMYDFLSTYQLPRDVGATYEYSNLGLGLLGHTLALRSGKSYEELVTERVLEPLGMRDTRITLTPAMRARLAPGHDAAGNPAGTWDLPTLAGAGALRSTVNDMLNYLAANLDSASPPMGGVLHTTHTPRVQTDGPSLRVGLAWHILERPKAQLVWHNGGTGGYHSFIGFDEARRVGVVVLANSSGSIDDIGFHLLDDQAPLQAPPIARKEIPIDPAVLDGYVGVYELAPTFHITVTRERNALFLQASGQQKLQLFPESETRFFLKEVDAQITFDKDTAGRATRLTLHQAGQNLPGRRVK